jgi:hypothetical protein
MATAREAILSVVKVLFALLIGGVAVPIVWFIIRLLGLIRPLGRAIGLDWLMWIGGPIIGGIAGGLVLRAIMSALEEEDKLSLVLGMIGGAIGGFCGSIMFFPIVAIL